MRTRHPDTVLIIFPSTLMLFFTMKREQREVATKETQKAIIVFNSNSIFIRRTEVPFQDRSRVETFPAGMKPCDHLLKVSLLTALSLKLNTWDPTSYGDLITRLMMRG